MWRTCLVAGLALAATERAVGAQPGDALAEARAAFARGDVPAAVALASQVLSGSPLSEEAVALKVEALSSANDWETALDTYDTFLAAGGSDNATILGHVARAVLREATLFYPSLRRGALGRLACAGDRDALLAFTRAPDSGRDDKVQTLLVRAKLGDVQAPTDLRALALGEAAGVRVAALQALVQLRDPGAERAVLAALAAQETFVRVAGARASRVLRLAAAEPALRAALGDASPLPATEAAAALAALGATDVEERLRKTLDHPSPELRLSALAGLLAAGQDAALLQRLREMADDPALPVWASAVEELAARDEEGARAALRHALDADDANVRLQALRSLARLPAAPARGDALDRLRELLHDPNTLIRIEAASLLLGPGKLCAS